MNFKGWRKEADFFTGKLSDINRQMALAGIAIIWIFRTTDQSNLIPDPLKPALSFLVLSLVVDLAHYLYGSIVWSSYVRYHEHRKTKSKEEIEPHIVWKLITYVFLLLKVTFLIIAYLRLMYFLNIKF